MHEQCAYICTVKPLFRGHLNIPEKVSLHDRCPLITSCLTWSRLGTVLRKCPLIVGCPLIRVSLEDRFNCTQKYVLNVHDVCVHTYLHCISWYYIMYYVLLHDLYYIWVLVFPLIRLSLECPFKTVHCYSNDIVNIYVLLICNVLIFKNMTILALKIYILTWWLVIYTVCWLHITVTFLLWG